MKFRLMFLIVVALCFFALPVSAQEDDFEASFGSVISVNPDNLVVMEYDFEADKDVEVTYMVTSETEYENINSVSELNADDPVEVVYEEKGSDKIAKVIVKDVFANESSGETTDEPGDLPVDEPVNGE